MSQIPLPVQLESQVVVCMNHLMRQGILQMALIPHLVRANLDPVVRIKTAGLARRAAGASDVVAVEVSSELADVVAQKTDDRAWQD